MTYRINKPEQADVLARIAAILSDRYEPFAAERVALRIVECVRAGDRFGNDLIVKSRSSSLTIVR